MSQVCVYISHNFKKNIDYNMVCDLLMQNDNFLIVSDIHKTEKSVEEQIAKCDYCIILAGMYLEHGYKQVIEEQISIAQQLQKKIVIIKPWGSLYCPKKLREYNQHVIAFDENNMIQMLEY